MSWMEVETKAKIENVKVIKEKIKSFAKFLKKTRKEDVYFTFKNIEGYPKERFRVRKEGKKYTLNFKLGHQGHKKTNVLAKEEFEFYVNDIKTFTAFLQEFGFKPFVQKVKHSEIYTYGNVNIEINNVKHLGWFLEVEVLCKKSQVQEAKKKIDKVLKLLSIKKSQIENTGYTKMLYEKGLFNKEI